MTYDNGLCIGPIGDTRVLDVVVSTTQLVPRERAYSISGFHLWAWACESICRNEQSSSTRMCLICGVNYKDKCTSVLHVFLLSAQMLALTHRMSPNTEWDRRRSDTGLWLTFAPLWRSPQKDSRRWRGLQPSLISRHTHWQQLFKCLNVNSAYSRRKLLTLDITDVSSVVPE